MSIGWQSIPTEDMKFSIPRLKGRGSTTPGCVHYLCSFDIWTYSSCTHKLASSRRVKFPKGLGRLIVYEIMRLNYRYYPRLYEDTHGYVRRSPLSVERLRPSNYDYAWCKIPYGPRWWSTHKVKEYVEGRVRIISFPFPSTFNL